MPDITHPAPSLWQRIGFWIAAFEAAEDITEYDILHAQFKRLERRFNDLEQRVSSVEHTPHHHRKVI